MVDLTIFSKNRPMQLEMLLWSLHRLPKQIYRPYIIYKATDEANTEAYNKLSAEYAYAVFVPETTFTEEVKRRVFNLRSDYCLFLCDDNVVVREISVTALSMGLALLKKDNEYHALSLRMNPCINHCFPAKKDMRIPHLDMLPGGDFFSWNWQNEGIDQHTCWGYPMAVNTHIYRTNDIRPVILDKRDYINVNALEAHMNRNRMRERTRMLSFANTKVFDVCNNYVRGDCGGSQDMTIRYLDGERIKREFTFPDNMAHGIVEFSYKGR